MAEYGLQIRNANGNLLIDSVFQNYTLHQRFRGSWNAVYEVFGGVEQGRMTHTDLYFAQTLSTTEPPIICAVGVGRYIAAGYLGYPGRWTGVRLITDRVSGEGAVTYEVDAYAPASVASFQQSGNYGLQVYNSTGGLVFDSRKYPLRIHSTPSMPVMNFINNDSDRLMGNGVLPDMQFFRAAVSDYYENVQGNSTTSTDFRNRLCAKRVGSTVYWSQKGTAYSNQSTAGGIIGGIAYARDGLDEDNLQDYELRPAYSTDKVPYCLIKATPF